jgi:hypothetical protein
LDKLVNKLSNFDLAVVGTEMLDSKKQFDGYYNYTYTLDVELVVVGIALLVFVNYIAELTDI